MTILPCGLSGGFSACAQSAGSASAPAVRQPSAAGQSTGPSSADSLLKLLNTPGTFDVLRRHIPFFVNLTEHGLIPAFPSDMTLDDLLNVPEARVTPEILKAINAEFARLPAEPQPSP